MTEAEQQIFAIHFHFASDECVSPKSHQLANQILTAPMILASWLL
jgi:hypothetical protein